MLFKYEHRKNDKKEMQNKMSSFWIGTASLDIEKRILDLKILEKLRRLIYAVLNESDST